MTTWNTERENGILTFKEWRGVAATIEMHVGKRSESDGLRTIETIAPGGWSTNISLTADQQFALAAELLQMSAEELGELLGTQGETGPKDAPAPKDPGPRELRASAAARAAGVLRFSGMDADGIDLVVVAEWIANGWTDAVAEMVGGER